MKILRITLNSLVLAAANLVCILVAYSIYILFFRLSDQVAIQAPVATLLSVAVFLGWSYLVKRYLPGRWALAGRGEYIWTYLAAFLWILVLFVPLHYITQGYLTSLGNLIAIWLFQLPVNILVLLSSAIMELRRVSPA